MGGAISSAAPNTSASVQADAPPDLKSSPRATNDIPPQVTRLEYAKRDQGSCQSQDTRGIVVCGQRREGYRLDPNVIEAKREMETNSRSANAEVPAAQLICSVQPMGCGKGMESLDLANVAIVLGTTAIRAVKGEDWTKKLVPGRQGEYQLYKQAEQRRKAQDAERAAARLRMIAREEEAHSSSAHSPSQ